MSDTLSVWDQILKTIRTLTTWPLVVLYLVLLFRRAISEQIPALFQSLEALVTRLVSLKYKGIEADFQTQALRKFAANHSPELTTQLLLKLSDPTAPRTLQPSKSAFAPAAVLDVAEPEEQKVIGLLLEASSQAKTSKEIAAETGQPPAVVDKTLTQLLEKDIIAPSFSPQHDVVFGLRAR